MRILTVLKSSGLMLAMGTLAACGGGGGGGGGGDGPAVVNAPSFGDVNSTASSPLLVTVLNANARTVATDTGRLDRGENTGAIGGLSGTLSADRSQIDLTNGGAVTFSDPGDGFAVRFNAETAVPTQGIAGIATPTSDLPSGTASFAGDTVMTATNGTDVFDLTGTATITADFGEDGGVTTVLSDLTGVQQPPLAAAIPVPDAGTLTLSGSVIDGARFTGGTAALTSDVLTLTGDETVGVQGAFYGPGGGEAGGVFAITGGETEIFGDFLAD